MQTANPPCLNHGCDCKLLTSWPQNRTSDRRYGPVELPLGLVARVCASPSRQDSVFSLPCLGIHLWLRTTPLPRLQTLSPHSRHSPVPSLEPHRPNQGEKKSKQHHTGGTNYDIISILTVNIDIT